MRKNLYKSVLISLLAFFFSYFHFLLQPWPSMHCLCLQTIITSFILACQPFVTSSLFFSPFHFYIFIYIALLYIAHSQILSKNSFSAIMKMCSGQIGHQSQESPAFCLKIKASPQWALIWCHSSQVICPWPSCSIFKLCAQAALLTFLCIVPYNIINLFSIKT